MRLKVFKWQWSKTFNQCIVHDDDIRLNWIVVDICSVLSNGQRQYSTNKSYNMSERERKKKRFSTEWMSSYNVHGYQSHSIPIYSWIKFEFVFFSLGFFVRLSFPFLHQCKPNRRSATHKMSGFQVDFPKCTNVQRCRHCVVLALSLALSMQGGLN